MINRLLTDDARRPPARLFTRECIEDVLVIVVSGGKIAAGRERIGMHIPQRDPFYEGLWADVQEGIDEAHRGELLEGEDVFAELLREEPATAATVDSLARYRDLNGIFA